MNTWDTQYLKVVRDIIKNGDELPCRTGETVKKLLNIQLKHDLKEGFPLLTARSMPWKSIRVELEGFLKGISDKAWYNDRNCFFWQNWANPTKMPKDLTDEQRKEWQLTENDLGPVYGSVWREFSAYYPVNKQDRSIDQLQDVVNRLKTNPYDRRLLVLAYNPLTNDQASLPSCIPIFQFSYFKERLHLSYGGRSSDIILGGSNDFPSMALLLCIVAKEVGMIPGTVTANLTDAHIYSSHFENAVELLDRKSYTLPTLELDDSVTINNFEADMAQLENYKNDGKLSFSISV